MLLKGKVICLDPGHSGPSYDPGCVGPAGTSEATVAWDITNRVADILSNRWGATVVMTKKALNDYESDSLSYRAKVANNAGADIFVSVHLNAGSPAAHGTETYYFQGSAAGKALADSVQTQLVACLGLTDRGLKTANYAVLRLTDMTAILTEVCFLSNPDEETYINRDDIRQKAAEAIAQGIVDYLVSQHERRL